MNTARQTHAVVDQPESLRREFEAYLSLVKGRYRYTQSKYSLLLGEKWAEVRRIVEGKAVLSVPSHFEIHPCEPCQLHCKYCRGELRPVPRVEEIIDTSRLLQLIQDIHRLNPTAFIRFSGTIGEPLLHPDVRKFFALIRSLRGLHYGVTTNGLLLHKDGVVNELMFADYVHVSLDAGSDDTYRTLKGGRPGDFGRVIENLATLRSEKRENQSAVDLIVSLVIQEENYAEIPRLSRTLREIGINTFELKMQHFDERRHMTPVSLHLAYENIREVQVRDSGPEYSIIVVQPEEAALAKLRGGARSVDFPQCYANRLGLNATIDSRGQLQSCCQYYQGTLGVQGEIGESLIAVWGGHHRQAVLDKDPRAHCIGCSPSDEFVNRFVAFLVRAHGRDSSFLDWVETRLAADSATTEVH
jgi:MoaA/NifB/PqqE/SkfB family radical SAM enzyme